MLRARLSEAVYPATSVYLADSDLISRGHRFGTRKTLAHRPARLYRLAGALLSCRRRLPAAAGLGCLRLRIYCGWLAAWLGERSPLRRG
eukprot:10895328-Heterocapsa_arctica.AAC.1